MSCQAQPYSGIAAMCSTSICPKIPHWHPINKPLAPIATEDAVDGVRLVDDGRTDMDPSTSDLSCGDVESVLANQIHEYIYRSEFVKISEDECDTDIALFAPRKRRDSAYAQDSEERALKQVRRELLGSTRTEAQTLAAAARRSTDCDILVTSEIKCLTGNLGDSEHTPEPNSDLTIADVSATSQIIFSSIPAARSRDDDATAGKFNRANSRRKPQAVVRPALDVLPGITASQLFFATYQLVEKVLLELPQANILVLQRVNKTFRYVLQRSRELQVTVFFEAGPGTPRAEDAVSVYPTHQKQPLAFLNKIFMSKTQYGTLLKETETVASVSIVSSLAAGNLHTHVMRMKALPYTAEEVAASVAKHESWQRVRLCHGYTNDLWIEVVVFMPSTHLHRPCWVSTRVPAGTPMGKIWANLITKSEVIRAGLC